MRHCRSTTMFITTSVAAVVLASAVPFGLPAIAAPPLDRLVYSSARGGNTDLWAANVDGTEQVRLTTDPADDAYPDISHNRNLIAFTRGVNRNCSSPYYGHLWVMNDDGSAERQLLNDDAWNEFAPDFSPDGKRILFTRVPAGGGCFAIGVGLWVINVDGTGLEPLKSHAMFGSWSPDGERIAYGNELWTADDPDSPLGTKVTMGSNNIWVMNADGSGSQPLTTLGGAVPRWSPDGTRIAFTSFRRAGKGDVWVMDADGQNQNYVTSSAGKDGFATWSPDSRRIAFASSRHSPCPADLSEQCPHRIYTMAADGTDVQPVADNADYDIHAAYFPRGARNR